MARDRKHADFSWAVRVYVLEHYRRLAEDPPGGREGQAVTRRPKLASQNVKRSIVIGGRKTSIGLEGAFWVSFKDIAARERNSISALATRIATDRGHANLSSVIRLFVLEHYRRQAEQATADAKGKQ